MSNETCPPVPPSQGAQVNLNTPLPNVVDPTFIQLHNLQSVNTLCTAGMSPGMVTAVVMQILMNHFSSPSLIFTESLQQYIWTPNATTTKMRIAQNTTFDASVSGMLPALIVKRGDIKAERRVMGDRYLVDSLQGISTFVRFHTGTHTVFCVAETDGEAEDLSLEVFDILNFLSPPIVEILPFHDFQIVGIGELGVLEELGNKIGVPVTIQYSYEYGWAVKPIAPRLKSLSINVQG